jgi:hypothetical protein
MVRRFVHFGVLCIAKYRYGENMRLSFLRKYRYQPILIFGIDKTITNIYHFKVYEQCYAIGIWSLKIKLVKTVTASH